MGKYCFINFFILQTAVCKNADFNRLRGSIFVKIPKISANEIQGLVGVKMMRVLRQRISNLSQEEIALFKI